MNKLADQVIMADVISHPRYLKDFHETGFNALRLDNSVHWKPTSLLPLSWHAISGPWSLAANNAIDAAWEAMD